MEGRLVAVFGEKEGISRGANVARGVWRLRRPFTFVYCLVRLEDVKLW